MVDRVELMRRSWRGVMGWPRRRLIILLAASAAAAAAYYWAGLPPGPEVLPFLLVLYITAAAGHRSTAWLGVAIAVVAVAAGTLADRLTGQPPEDLADLIAVAAVLVAVVALGEMNRSRRAYLGSVAERAAVAERLRIARELHDVLAHQLTVINMQAGGALLRRDIRPELADTALEVVKEASRDALRELRATLGVLRSGESADFTADTARMSPAAEPAMSDVERAGQRIIQEALTNVSRYAQGGVASIRIRYTDQGVEIEVRDTGPGGATNTEGAGQGLKGMRERAAEIGGRLEARPTGDGGFRVHAFLPAPPSMPRPEREGPP
jgi:signal transduction histidine kinase